MDIPLDFFPDPARAHRIDRRMRDQLAGSLDYLARALADQWGERHLELDRLLANLHNGACYPPSTFGLYYELTAALLNEDQVAAHRLMRELFREKPLTAGEVIVHPLDRIEPETNRVRYQRLMDTDPDTPFHIVSPDPLRADAAIRQFHAGMCRLHQTLPELAGEFEALIREVVLVEGADDLDYGFAGGSCYMLWGALFINASAHQSDIAIIEAIAHEGGHSFLFGLTIDEPLVLNDDRELFTSPLRDDPRPMDGIYHATYVSARMHWAMSELLTRGNLTTEEATLAAAHLDRDRKNFWSGHATVATNARLSETGRLLLAGVHDYMSAFPPNA